MIVFFFFGLCEATTTASKSPYPINSKLAFGQQAVFI